MVCVSSSRRRFYNQSSIDSPRLEKRHRVTSHDRPGCDRRRARHFRKHERRNEVTNPTPLASWTVAFTSERGIKQRHNVRAFLLSVYASATSSDDAGIRQLIGPVTAALKAVP
jgi:hypothetical protein